MSNYVDSIRVGGADYPIDIPRLGATSEASNVQGNTAFAKIHTLGSEKTTLADIEEAVGWVGNNLFNGRSDRTGGGITVTKQTDGKYLVTGTAQSSGTVALTIGQFTAKAGVTYHLSGFPTGYTGTSSFNLALYGISTPTLYAEDRGNGATFTRNSDTRMNVVVVIPASYVCPDNFLWSPMISRNGGEYVPYHPTVQEELWDGEVSEPKNLIKYRADLPKVYTENTVTFTVNDDYSVTVNTSAPTTADVRFALTNELVNFYPDGNYVLSDVNGSNNDVYTTIWRRKQAGTAFSNLGTDGEQPCPFTVNNADKGRYLISLYIKSGKTVNNVTLYPMICTLEDWKKSHAYSPYYVPLKDSMFRRSEQRVLGAKNLMYPEVGWRIAGDASSGFYLSNDDANAISYIGKVENNTDYIISKKSVGNRFRIMAFTKNPADARRYADRDTNASTIVFNNDLTSYRFNSGNYNYVCFAANITDSVDETNIKGMLRLATDPDDTYAPYAETNFELTQNKFNSSNVAPTEDGAGASKAYTTGQYLIHNGELRKVTTAIASGAEITDNNTGSATVGGELEQINSDLTDIQSNTLAPTFTPSSGVSLIENRLVMRNGILTGHLWLNITSASLKTANSVLGTFDAISSVLPVYVLGYMEDAQGNITMGSFLLNAGQVKVDNNYPLINIGMYRIIFMDLYTVTSNEPIMQADNT